MIAYFQNDSSGFNEYQECRFFNITNGVTVTDFDDFKETK